VFFHVFLLTHIFSKTAGPTLGWIGLASQPLGPACIELQLETLNAMDGSYASSSQPSWSLPDQLSI